MKKLSYVKKKINLCDNCATFMQLSFMSINQQSGQISKSALRKLKKRLPKGFISQAMEDLDNRYHKTSIYRVLNGQTTNGEILEVLMDIADISEERKERLEARAKGESEKTES